jgi:hypothetical protein
MKRRTARYEIEYTAFKGTKYADSGHKEVVEASTPTSAINKLKKELHIKDNAINKITKG